MKHPSWTWRVDLPVKRPVRGWMTRPGEVSGPFSFALHLSKFRSILCLLPAGTPTLALLAPGIKGLAGTPPLPRDILQAVSTDWIIDGKNLQLQGKTRTDEQSVAP